MATKHKVYAMYNGDEFIAVGTAKELAEMTGKPIGSIWSNITHTKSGQNKYRVTFEVKGVE